MLVSVVGKSRGGELGIHLWPSGGDRDRRQVRSDQIEWLYTLMSARRHGLHSAFESVGTYRGAARCAVLTEDGEEKVQAHRQGVLDEERVRAPAAKNTDVGVSSTGARDEGGCPRSVCCRSACGLHGHLGMECLVFPDSGS